MLKPLIRKKVIFVGIYFLFFLFWMQLAGYHVLISNTGIQVLTILAYAVTIFWMIVSFKKMEGGPKVFLAFFRCRLFLSRLSRGYFIIQPAERSYGSQLPVGRCNSLNWISIFLYGLCISNESIAEYFADDPVLFKYHDDYYYGL